MVNMPFRPQSSIESDTSHTANTDRGLVFSEPLDNRDIQLRCDDDCVILAHKSVLASSCKYYYEKLCRNNSLVSVVNPDGTRIVKVYGFARSSAACRAMLQYFYQGYIYELESPEVPLEHYLRYISELLEYSLLKTRAGLGGLADYLVSTMCSKGVVDAGSAIRRLDLGMEISQIVGPDARIQKLIDRMRKAIPKLPFDEEAFTRHVVSPETLELILRDVQINATEVDVCRAVARWAHAYIADPESEITEQRFIRIDDNIMKHIDLMYVSVHDCNEVLPRLRIFSEDVIANAKRQHVLFRERDPYLYERMGCWNASRGTDISSGTTRVRPPHQHLLPASSCAPSTPQSAAQGTGR